MKLKLYTQSILIHLKEFISDQLNLKEKELYKAKNNFDFENTESILITLDILQKDLFKIKRFISINNLIFGIFLKMYKRERFIRKKRYLSIINRKKNGNYKSFLKKILINKHSIQEELDILEKRIEKVTKKMEKRNNRIVVPLNLKSNIINEGIKLFKIYGYNTT